MKPMNLVSIGMLIIFIGFILVFLGSLLQAKQPQNEKEGKGDSNVKVAVGGFFGPIPFGFGNDKTLMYVVLGVSVFFMLVWFILPHLR